MFEEHIEKNNYNTYSRVRNGKKTFLALDMFGKARRMQIPVTREHLGNLSKYALAMTTPAKWKGQTHCPARRHRGKLKPPSPEHKKCMQKVRKQKMKPKRRHKKPIGLKKKRRHPNSKRRHKNGTTTTTEVTWDESTMSTMSTTTDAEFFRSATALEAVARA
ncbi:Fibroblast growth factor [Operophtera brumata]|uniref:Fibroblast growth factor n=1 Tax=Operophtera brumata TaxID=104452 RepID=A0A0L7L6T6_OPEBR|nr:Fibroblast growth factor [Operophtera brumata]